MISNSFSNFLNYFLQLLLTLVDSFSYVKISNKTSPDVLRKYFAEYLLTLHHIQQNT